MVLDLLIKKEGFVHVLFHVLVRSCMCICCYSLPTIVIVLNIIYSVLGTSYVTAAILLVHLENWNNVEVIPLFCYSVLGTSSLDVVSVHGIVSLIVVSLY